MGCYQRSVCPRVCVPSRGGDLLQSPRISVFYEDPQKADFVACNSPYNSHRTIG